MTSVMWCVSQSSVFNNTLLPAQYMYNCRRSRGRVEAQGEMISREAEPMWDPKCVASWGHLVQGRLQKQRCAKYMFLSITNVSNVCWFELFLQPCICEQIGRGGCKNLHSFLCDLETHNLIIKSQSPCNTNNDATLRSVPPFPELHSLLVFGACIRLIWLLLIQHVSTKQVKLIWQCLGQGTPQSD